MNESYIKIIKNLIKDEFFDEEGTEIKEKKVFIFQLLLNSSISNFSEDIKEFKENHKLQLFFFNEEEENQIFKYICQKQIEFLNILCNLDLEKEYFEKIVNDTYIELFNYLLLKGHRSRNFFENEQNIEETNKFTVNSFISCIKKYNNKEEIIEYIKKEFEQKITNKENRFKLNCENIIYIILFIIAIIGCFSFSHLISISLIILSLFFILCYLVAEKEDDFITYHKILTIGIVFTLILKGIFSIFNFFFSKNIFLLYENFSLFALKTHSFLANIDFKIYLYSILIIIIICLHDRKNTLNDIDEKLEEIETTKKHLNDVKNPLAQYMNLDTDIIKIELSANLAKDENNCPILSKISKSRKKLSTEYGVIFPEVRTLGNLAFADNKYEIFIREKRVGSGHIYEEMQFILEKNLPKNFENETTNFIKEYSNVYESFVYWIPKNTIKKSILNYEDLILEHLNQLIIDNINEIITIKDVYTYKKYIEQYYDNVIASKINLCPAATRIILVELIKANISIKDIALVWEKIIEFSEKEDNPYIISKKLISHFKYNN